MVPRTRACRRKESSVRGALLFFAALSMILAISVLAWPGLIAWPVAVLSALLCLSLLARAWRVRRGQR